ncbi:MAG: protein kinase [Myxococcaceae bacterium]|nr:protein kinase [Myxococcaceae bacterium]
MSSPLTDASIAPGTLLAGRYRVDALVAEGGFGRVYAGHHLVLDGPIAIKVLRGDRDPVRYVPAFLEEARTLAKLRHPNIVSVLDAGVLPDGNLPWIALEWCDGSTLERAVEDGEVRTPMTPADAWRLLRPVASAIACAHEQGIVHRDLKPSNIILARRGGQIIPRVVDFGVAKAVADEPLPSGQTLTREPSAYSPPYAAPEQVTASRTGPWTDVHSLGLLFVELVTGRRPYGDGNPLERAVSPERPTPRVLGVEVGEALEAVLTRALDLRPAARFQNAGALIAAVDDALEGRAPSSAADTDDRPRRRRARAGVTFACFAAVVAVAALVVRHHSAETLAAGGTRWQIQEGSWRVEDGALIGSGGQVMSDAELRDGHLTVDFEPIRLPPNGTTIGIGFRAQPVLEREDGSGYGVNFGIGNRGLFQVFEGAHGGWQPADPAFPRFRPATLRPGRNRVEVDARGEAFEIRLNGETIARVEDDTYAAGRVTLYVQHRAAEVRFSNFEIR